MTPLGAVAQEVFEELATERLREPGTGRRRMFGREGLTVHGKFFAFLNRERLVLKLPAATTATLVADGQARIAVDLSPTMRKWVSLPAPAAPADAERWRHLLSEAHTYALAPPQP